MPPRSRRAWLALGLSVAVLCSIRGLLPLAVEHRVVTALARDDRYAGSFDDVDVSVLRLSYSIEGLRLVKRNGRVPVPFVTAPRVEYGFDGSALLRGRIAGRIEIASPSLNLVDGPTAEVRQGPAGVDWRITMRELFPTNVNRVDIRDGTIHFRNFHTKPEVDVYVDDIELAVSNLASRGGAVTSGAVELQGRGVTMNSGSIEADVTLFRNTREPSFDCTVSIKGAQIAEWNSLLRAYAGLDVESGTARVNAALRARDGQLQGHLTPSLAEVQVLDFSKEITEQSLLTSLGESSIDVISMLVGDRKRHVIEVRIPISGTIRNPVRDDWASVRSLAWDALVDALRLRGDAEASTH